MTRRKSGQARKTPSSSPTRGEDGLRLLDHDAGAAHVESGDADQEQEINPYGQRALRSPAADTGAAHVVSGDADQEDNSFGQSAPRSPAADAEAALEGGDADRLDPSGMAEPESFGPRNDDLSVDFPHNKIMRSSMCDVGGISGGA